MPELPQLKPIRSNRTIVGLKHGELQGLATNGILQQSHHCGIETFAMKVSFPDLKFTQQSHHCGIETGLSLPSLVIPTPAAIAPLWD